MRLKSPASPKSFLLLCQVDSSRLFPPKYCSLTSRIQSSWGEKTRTIYVTVQKSSSPSSLQTRHSSLYVSSQVRSQFFNFQVEVESQVPYFSVQSRHRTVTRAGSRSPVALLFSWIDCMEPHCRGKCVLSLTLIIKTCTAEPAYIIICLHLCFVCVVQVTGSLCFPLGAIKYLSV